jgi:hypothetical protein
MGRMGVFSTNTAEKLKTITLKICAQKKCVDKNQDKTDSKNDLLPQKYKGTAKSRTVRECYAG